MARALISLRPVVLRLTLLCGVSVLMACGDPAKEGNNAALLIPERVENTYITDQFKVAGNTLFIWNDEGGCRLQVNQKNNQQDIWLKPMAPCYFIHSPGTQQPQVFKQDKTTRVLAILGTPVQQKQNAAQRCGREVQGLLIDHRGKVSLSERIVAGSVYCADKGLDNFQYSLFNRS